MGVVCSFGGAIMKASLRKPHWGRDLKKRGNQPSKYPESERGGRCKGPGAGAAVECGGNSRRGQCGWSNRSRKELRGDI